MSSDETTRFDRATSFTVRCGPELSFEGLGIARLGDKTIFVRGAAPGELVEARFVARRRGYDIAEVVDVLEASPSRVEPRCEHFGVCGGCKLQHLDAEAQLAAKAGIVAHALSFPEADIAVHASDPYRYRMRARFFSDGRRIGFRARNSHELVAFDRCPVLTDDLEAAILDYRRRLEDSQVAAPPREFEVVAGDDACSARPALPGFVMNEVAVTVAGERYFASGGAFFQQNRQLVPAFVDRIVELAGNGALALDLYSGVGLFTMRLAAHFDRVIGIEASENAHRLAELTRGLRALPGVEFRCYEVRTWLSGFVSRTTSGSAKRPDAIVLDPPRAGASDILEALVTLAVPRIVYVSCEVSALGRDLVALRKGGYRVASVDVFDLFPQTHHVEAVALLERHD
ncbi:MAG: class I SAM-dependent RNA methyltransferase [Planctomycetes bacterium]|nr:class I SAM-dependent RNA methyltransferase [Planctomycetota bacterium]